jgi:AcrR family transcriptional regulator
MLNYYFGSRDRLVSAVVEERLLPVMAELRDRLGEAHEANAAAAARTFVGSLHAVIVRHPWLPALWVREVLPENGALRSVLSERIAPDIALPLAQRFAAGQRAGQINAALEPRLLFVSLIGLTMLPFAAQHLWRRTFSADDIDDRRMLEHTLALLAGGLGA